jgi:hypothetical protein
VRVQPGRLLRQPVEFAPVLGIGERLEAARVVADDELAEALDLFAVLGEERKIFGVARLPVEVDERERPPLVGRPRPR